MPVKLKNHKKPRRALVDNKCPVMMQKISPVEYLLIVYAHFIKHLYEDSR